MTSRRRQWQAREVGEAVVSERSGGLKVAVGCFYAFSHQNPFYDFCSDVIAEFRTSFDLPVTCLQCHVAVVQLHGHVPAVSCGCRVAAWSRACSVMRLSWS